jgi:enhancing lycopene biosynthesis protein 2
MRVGVLLGGCGLYDGSDAQETVLVLLALEAAGERPVLLAPDMAQERTVDHLTAVAQPEARNVLRESARLGRGSVRALDGMRPDDLEALVIPGGYGPVVNFSTGFAVPGAVHRLDPRIESWLRHFLDERKPLGLVGLGEVPVRMVLGLEIDAPQAPPSPGDLLVDEERRLVHTPGFAGFSRLLDVKTGIDAMVREVMRLMEDRSRGERSRP